MVRLLWNKEKKKWTNKYLIFSGALCELFSLSTDESKCWGRARRNHIVAFRSYIKRQRSCIDSFAMLSAWCGLYSRLNYLISMWLLLFGIDCAVYAGNFLWLLSWKALYCGVLVKKLLYLNEFSLQYNMQAGHQRIVSNKVILFKCVSSKSIVFKYINVFTHMRAIATAWSELLRHAI